MTKLKSKKMTKSTFAVIIMAILMVAMLAFGGTYAWFTATATQIDTEGVVTGKIVLNSSGDFTSSTVVMPGDSLLDTSNAISLVAGSDIDAEGEYVAVKLTVTIGSVYAGTGADDAETISDLITVTPAAGWVKHSEAESNNGKTITYIFVYGTDSALTALKSTDQAKPLFTAIDFTATDNWTQDAGTSDKGYMGTTLDLVLNARAMQVANRTGYTAANLVADVFPA